MTPAQFLRLHAVGDYQVPHANTHGTAFFTTPELAAQFRRLLLDDFHPAGYGTTCAVAPAKNGHGGVVASWFIGSTE